MQGEGSTEGKREAIEWGTQAEGGGREEGSLGKR